MDAIHPDDRLRVRDAAMNRQISGVYSEEYRILRPDGSMRWIWDRAFPIRDASGTVYRIAGFAEDVTDRKRVEAALIESERRYRVLFDDNPSMYFMVDATGIVLSVNRFGAERLGYDVQELVGLSVLNIFHPSDQDDVRRNLDACLSEMGRPRGWEYRKVRKDGSVIWVRETAQAVLNAQQAPVVLIVCEDITAMKEAEVALHDSEEFKNQILRSSADCIKVLDLEGSAAIHERRGATLLHINDLNAYLNKPGWIFGRGMIGMPPWPHWKRPRPARSASSSASAPPPTESRSGGTYRSPPCSTRGAIPDASWRFPVTSPTTDRSRIRSRQRRATRIRHSRIERRILGRPCASRPTLALADHPGLVVAARA
jgi:PAS domain S-box-containing protein